MSTVKGVKVGLRDLHYALLNGDASSGASYGTPVLVNGAITANINPNSAIATLFADDGPMEVASQLGNIELELEVADIPLGIQAVFLGHTITKGIMKSVASDTPPWLAIGFKSLKSNNAYRYCWVYKGKFKEPESPHKTKTDTVEFQTSTISGQFTKRDFDDAWKIQADANEDGFEAATGTEWFTAVQEEPAP